MLSERPSKTLELLIEGCRIQDKYAKTNCTFYISICSCTLKNHLQSLKTLQYNYSKICSTCMLKLQNADKIKNTKINGDIVYSWISRFNIIKIPIFSKLICKFNKNLFKILE